jgi:hypothetical protein
LIVKIILNPKHQLGGTTNRSPLSSLRSANAELHMPCSSVSQPGITILSVSELNLRNLWLE